MIRPVATIEKIDGGYIVELYWLPGEAEVPRPTKEVVITDENVLKMLAEFFGMEVDLAS